MKTHKMSAAGFLALGFSAVVVAISATTTFGFFYNYFAGLIPAGVVDGWLGALISGGVGVTLFDVASVVWLYLFLHHAETPEQRAVSLIMTIFTFTGSAAASVAYLGLTATGELAMDAATAATVSNVALIVVILGVVANFGAIQAYQRYSLENKVKVAESDRRDLLQRAEEEHAAYLTELIAQQVKENLATIAPQLAAEQARRLAGAFYRREAAKYEHVTALPHPQQSPPTPEPTPTPTAVANNGHVPSAAAGHDGAMFQGGAK